MMNRQGKCFGQNFVDKFKKLSKIGVSLGCFAVDFSKFSSTTVDTFFV